MGIVNNNIRIIPNLAVRYESRTASFRFPAPSFCTIAGVTTVDNDVANTFV